MTRKILFVLLLLVGAYYGYGETRSEPAPAGLESEAALYRAIGEQREGIQVRGSGTVVRILADDRDGSRHQRFILELADGASLLVAHAIDLAPRVASLSVGDTVSFYGEYEWNDRGGVIHWTHHDPGGLHVGGWLEHKGRRYD